MSPLRLPVYRGENRELNPREREFLGKLCRGLTNKEIAAEAEVSEQTVKNTFRSVYMKLGVENRTGAIIHALKSGLVDLAGEP